MYTSDKTSRCWLKSRGNIGNFLFQSILTTAKDIHDFIPKKRMENYDNIFSL